MSTNNASINNGGGGKDDEVDDTHSLLGARAPRSDSTEKPSGHTGPIHTVDEAIDAVGMGAFQWKLFVLCGMGSFVEALETSNLSIMLPVLHDYWQLTNYHLAFLTSLTFLGMGIGALVFGRVSDIYGRRPVFLVSLAVSSLFGMLSALSPDIYVFTLFRVLLGIGYGANLVTDFVLFAEFVPVAYRGKLMALTDCFYGLGSVFGALLAWAVIPNLGWRYLVVFAAVPPLAMLLFRRNIPESPRFLAMKQRHEELREVMKSVAIQNGASAETIERIDNMHISASENVDADDANTISQIFNPALTRISSLLVVIWFFNALGTCLYMWLPLHLKEDPDIKSATGNPMTNVYQSALIMAIGEAIGAVVLAFIVQLIDRRLILGFGLAFLGVSSYLLGAIKSAVAIFALLPFVSGVRAAILLLLYVFTPELYPTVVRTTALGMFSAINRLGPILGNWVTAFALNWSFFTVAAIFATGYLVASAASFFLPYDTRNAHLAARYHEEKHKRGIQTKDADHESDSA